MAYNVLFLESAVDEFEAIVCYISGYSEKGALNFKSDWYKTIENLRDGFINYGLSRFENLAKQGYHAVLFNKYVLLYFEEGNVRTIAHIFAQKQDYANLV